MDITTSTAAPNAPAFIAGQIYPLTPLDAAQIIAAMGLGAFLLDSPPDFTRGRRCLRSGEISAEWEFWTMGGRRVHASMNMDGGLMASVSNDIDLNRPEPQFTIEKALIPARKPQKCIKPDCENLVAASGVRKPEAGVFKNYRGTGACQQGHNIYFCAACKTPHSYASAIGQKHYAQNKIDLR